MMAWGVAKNKEGFAFIDFIADFDANASALAREPGNAPAWTLFEGHFNEMSIDGIRMRHIIEKDTVIVYSGGPLVVENSFFINCNFRLRMNSQTKRFADALFLSPAVNFTQP